jgi:hypothetical protein
MGCVADTLASTAQHMLVSWLAASSLGCGQGSALQSLRLASVAGSWLARFAGVGAL